MLLVTHAGLTVNLAHVAYIHCRQEEDNPDAPRPRRGEAPVRVLLILSCGSSVVLARDLPPAAARFLREAVTRAWAEGMALTDARDLLKRYAEETYPVASTMEAQTAPELTEA